MSPAKKTTTYETKTVFVDVPDKKRFTKDTMVENLNRFGYVREVQIEKKVGEEKILIKLKPKKDLKPIKLEHYDKQCIETAIALRLSEHLRPPSDDEKPLPMYAQDLKRICAISAAEHFRSLISASISVNYAAETVKKTMDCTLIRLLAQYNSDKRDPSFLLIERKTNKAPTTGSVSQDVIDQHVHAAIKAAATAAEAAVKKEANRRVKSSSNEGSSSPFKVPMNPVPRSVDRTSKDAGQTTPTVSSQSNSKNSELHVASSNLSEASASKELKETAVSKGSKLPVEDTLAAGESEKSFAADEKTKQNKKKKGKKK